jgi:EAL domain-containing protein (putative c-di-GMP-specific phosphodiesterase class I)
VAEATTLIQRLTLIVIDKALTFSREWLDGLQVVAQGVEDEATLVALRRLGADVIQGYHLGRPMGPDALTSWLAEHEVLPVTA